MLIASVVCRRDRCFGAANYIFSACTALAVPLRLSEQTLVWLSPDAADISESARAVDADHQAAPQAAAAADTRPSWVDVMSWSTESIEVEAQVRWRAAVDMVHPGFLPLLLRFPAVCSCPRCFPSLLRGQGRPARATLGGGRQSTSFRTFCACSSFSSSSNGCVRSTISTMAQEKGYCRSRVASRISFAACLNDAEMITSHLNNRMPCFSVPPVSP